MPPNMSAPQQTTQFDNAQQVEDCRDYLRTGRCKYGASCKYNHPANVQNGGGMKVPLDPSEPLFPIRPNEPICQYYLKHGMCKFGQACKFHHPPHITGQGLNNGQMLMNSVRQNDSNSSQFVMNSMVTDPSGQGVMMQLLPQRPDEPDCIYFLKNGRCKYGATCRYHHPVSFQSQQQRIEKPRRQQVPLHDQKVHYVTQVVHTYPNGQIIVTDNSNPVTFINVDGFAQQGYQVISGNDGLQPYCVQTSVAAQLTEPNSSASSIASYDNPNDHVVESNGTYWYRSKRNDSTSSLSGSNVADSRNRVFMPHSVSDGNMTRRIRSTSYGSVGDNSSYYDTLGGSLPRNTSAGSWRSDRSIGFDPGQRVAPQQQYAVLQDGKVVDIRTIQSRGRPVVMSNPVRRNDLIGRRSTRPGEHDEGFTMMTSALLNMLDTPEEVSAENYNEDEYVQVHGDYAISMNGGGAHESRMIDRIIMEKSPPGLSRSLSPPNNSLLKDTNPSSGFRTIESASAMFQGLTIGGEADDNVTNNNNEVIVAHDSKHDESSSWSPTWHGALNGRNHVRSQSPQPILHSMMHHHHHQIHQHASTTPSDSDVGLYLP